MTEVRRTLRADSAFEAVLGLLLVTGPATGLLESLDLPAADGLVVAFGAALLPLAVVLWVWAAGDRPLAGPIWVLAAVNGVTGAALGLWMLVAGDDAANGGLVFVIAVAAILLVLAVVQLRLRRTA